MHWPRIGRGARMARERAQIDLGGPLLREREGVKLTGRSLSSRLAEVIDRLGRVTDAASPNLPAKAWELIGWVGWDALDTERLTSHPADVDTLVWQAIVTGVADWIDTHEYEPAPMWSRDLPQRLAMMTPVQRVAVLERIEAYGRAQAMERPS